MVYIDSNMERVPMEVPLPSRHVQGHPRMDERIKAAFREADEIARELQLTRRMLAIRIRHDGYTQLGGTKVLNAETFPIYLEREVGTDRAKEYAVMRVRDPEREDFNKKVCSTCGKTPYHCECLSPSFVAKR